MRFPSLNDPAASPVWENHVVAQTAQAALRLVPHHVHALGVQVHGASVALVVQVPPDWAQNDENITDIADELGALLGPEIAVRTEVG